jgi:hypothetical protein
MNVKHERSWEYYYDRMLAKATRLFEEQGIPIDFHDIYDRAIQKSIPKYIPPEQALEHAVAELQCEHRLPAHGVMLGKRLSEVMPLYKSLFDAYVKGYKRLYLYAHSDRDLSELIGFTPPQAMALLEVENKEIDRYTEVLEVCNYSAVSKRVWEFF